MIFHDLHHPEEDFFQEVKKGLSKDKKSLPPKFFYDLCGSDLFFKITTLPEYYLTRTELNILERQGNNIASVLPENLIIVEYGCGSSEKILHLLRILRRPASYVAIDISREHLLNLTKGLSRDFPDLEVIAVCADFTRRFSLPLNGQHAHLPRLAFFPGSSIGNFEPEAAKDFLTQIAEAIGPEGGLLIGVDLKKDDQVLNRAYNDPQGLTARFNKNVLSRINRELDGDFDLNKFQHRAFYNASKGRIEMHLESLEDQRIPIQDMAVKFSRGETIHTENSYKYHVEEFQALAEAAGWKAHSVWTDPQKLFSLQYFTRQS